MRARLTRFLFGAFLICLSLWGGGCGSATGGSEFGNPELAGTLPTNAPASFQTVKSQTSGCGGDLSTVRSVCGDTIKDSTVAGDCSFRIALEPDTYCYIQFLDSGGDTDSLLSWQDPTQPDDGSPRRLTSFVTMGRDQSHDLGRITLEGLVALPEFAPIGFDADGDGIPENEEAGFQTGTDTDGDGIPEIDTSTEPPAPGTGGSGTTDTPFTPAVGRSYTPAGTSCGLFPSMTLVSADDTEVILDPFGSNGATAFAPREDDPTMADSVSADLALFEIGGYACQIRIAGDLSLDVTCQNKQGGACEQSFLPAN